MKENILLIVPVNYLGFTFDIITTKVEHISNSTYEYRLNITDTNITAKTCMTLSYLHPCICHES